MHDFDCDGFVGQFPLWLVLLNPRATDRPGVTKVDGWAWAEVEGRKALLVFTDEDLADRYAKESAQHLSPDRTLVLAHFDDPEKMADFLEGIKVTFQFVTFDPNRIAGQTLRCTKLDYVISLFRNLKSAGPTE